MMLPSLISKCIHSVSTLYKNHKGIADSVWGGILKCPMVLMWFPFESSKTKQKGEMRFDNSILL